MSTRINLWQARALTAAIEAHDVPPASDLGVASAYAVIRRDEDGNLWITFEDDGEVVVVGYDGEELTDDEVKELSL